MLVAADIRPDDMLVTVLAVPWLSRMLSCLVGFLRGDRDPECERNGLVIRELCRRRKS